MAALKFKGLMLKLKKKREYEKKRKSLLRLFGHM